MRKNSWKVLVAATLAAGILLTHVTRAAFDSTAPAPQGDVQVVSVRGAQS